MPTDTYEQRRKSLKQRVDDAPKPLSQIVWDCSQRRGERLSRAYVGQVLRGSEQHTSEPILDLIEHELDAHDL